MKGNSVPWSFRNGVLVWYGGALAVVLVTLLLCLLFAGCAPSQPQRLDQAPLPADVCQNGVKPGGMVVGPDGRRVFVWVPCQVPK